MLSGMIQVRESWKELVSEIRAFEGPSLIYVMGASDRGKTTFCRYLSQSLGRDCVTAYVDCDPGQSLIGPPSTMGLEFPGRVPAHLSLPEILFFTGSISPQGHLLQNLSGIVKLVNKAREMGASSIILDSSGYVLDPSAREFQFTVIDLLSPDFLVAFQYPGELEGILANFARRNGTVVQRMPVPDAVRTRSRFVRQEYRRIRFQAYFRQAEVRRLSLQGIGLHGSLPELLPEMEGSLLVGLSNGDNFLVVMGVVRDCDMQGGRLCIYAPPFEPSLVRSVHFGSLHLDINDFTTRFKPPGK
jgi:polynucleotide 5'-hydroxyl-kinase GRC3/NOL9